MQPGACFAHGQVLRAPELGALCGCTRHDKYSDMNEIEDMWQQFQTMPFPDGYAGEEIAGICLVSLDTFAAGCISTFVGCRGQLDAERTAILRQCMQELTTVLPELEGEAKSYFEYLAGLCQRVLQSKT